MSVYAVNIIVAIKRWISTTCSRSFDHALTNISHEGSRCNLFRARVKETSVMAHLACHRRMHVKSNMIDTTVTIRYLNKFRLLRNSAGIGVLSRPPFVISTLRMRTWYYNTFFFHQNLSIYSSLDTVPYYMTNKIVKIKLASGYDQKYLPFDDSRTYK